MIPRNDNVYGSTDTILSGSHANTGAAQSRPSLALRRPLAAPHAHLLVRRGEGLLLRDRRPWRALPVTTCAPTRYLRHYITAHSPRKTVWAKDERGRSTKRLDGALQCEQRPLKTTTTAAQLRLTSKIDGSPIHREGISKDP